MKGWFYLMIENYICLNCKKFTICKWVNVIDKFDEEKKNPVGVTIEIKNCVEFEEEE